MKWKISSISNLLQVTFLNARASLEGMRSYNMGRQSSRIPNEKCQPEILLKKALATLTIKRT